MGQIKVPTLVDAFFCPTLPSAAHAIYWFMHHPNRVEFRSHRQTNIAVATMWAEPPGQEGKLTSAYLRPWYDMTTAPPTSQQSGHVT